MNIHQTWLPDAFEETKIGSVENDSVAKLCILWYWYNSYTLSHLKNDRDVSKCA